jgi:hypothetical protein
MTSWPEWLESGDKYLGASGARDKPSRFAGSLRYNLIALAFESYAMAMLDYKNHLPENHTISDLVDALDRRLGLEKELAERLVAYERFQRICSFIDYERIDPSREELDGFCEAVGELGALAHAQCIV